MAAKSLNYPFDIKELLRKRRAIRTELVRQPDLIHVKIAILGGSTTSEIRSIAELFILNSGFHPLFLESEYGKYFEDVVVDDNALREFKPDVAFIHTTHVNIVNAPRIFDSEQQVETCLAAEMARYQAIWSKLSGELGCLVIQNNFDLPPTRSLGGLDSTELFGKTNFLMRLNLEFARAARQNPKLIINDIHHLSARIGLDQWFDSAYWFNYKMAVSHIGTVHLAHALATLLRAAYGKTRKCLVLDLDNTMWGGVIGDDGMHNIQIGQGTPQGEAFSMFQQYCRELNERGILLAVCSKNDIDNARQGFSHPDSELKLESFTSFQANWEPKPGNIERIGAEINIGLDSLVFIDDNPAERAIVAAQLPPVAVPEVGNDVARFAEYIDREGYFEAIRINPDDAKRAAFYADNSERAAYQSQFSNYGEFLASLGMKAEIGGFSPTYLDRITQLSNKTNQFNLTSKRYTLAEMETMSQARDVITLYGRLADRFGDNGLVTGLAGKILKRSVHIDLWFMSCRVLKRDMEHAMLDTLVAKAIERGADEIIGHYHRSAKNDMVADHYDKLGFKLVSKADDASWSVWKLELAHYQPRNSNIKEIIYV
ncbi:FkbH-like protein [Oxalobacteraceae bacterium GrIS 1.11]